MSDRWAQYWANKYKWATENRADLDGEDILQAALMGEYIAKCKYTPDKGAFTTFSAYYIRNEIRDLLGIRKGQLPPTLISLDEPLPGRDGEPGEETRLDKLPDENAKDAAKEAYKQERREGVRAAVERIKDQRQREAIRLCYLEGKGAKEIAEALGVSMSEVYRLFHLGRRAMQRDRLLRQLVEIDVPYYARVGVEAFQTTHNSAVEYAVLILEREREKLLGKVKEIEQDV